MRGTSSAPRRRVLINDESSRWQPQYPTAYFQELLARPAQGAFTMPAAGRLRLTTVPGASDGWVGARLTGPTERVVTVPPMNPGGRHFIGVVEYDTRVEPNYPFVVELEVAYCEWQPIAVSC
jgi:hypothetical protein